MQTNSPPSTPPTPPPRPNEVCSKAKTSKVRIEIVNNEKCEKETNCSLINGRVNYII